MKCVQRRRTRSVKPHAHAQTNYSILLGGRVDRHNSLRNAVFSAPQSAALAPRKEVSSLIPGPQHRPADVYLPCWKGGRPAALDITVISMQQFTIQPAADNQGHALLVAETGKFATHGPACQAAGISFIPLAIETPGWFK